jgi:hypothetical protein
MHWLRESWLLALGCLGALLCVHPPAWGVPLAPDQAVSAGPASSTAAKSLDSAPLCRVVLSTLASTFAGSTTTARVQSPDRWRAGYLLLGQIPESSSPWSDFFPEEKVARAKISSFARPVPSQKIELPARRLREQSTGNPVSLPPLYSVQGAELGSGLLVPPLSFRPELRSRLDCLHEPCSAIPYQYTLLRPPRPLRVPRIPVLS